VTTVRSSRFRASLPVVAGALLASLALASDDPVDRPAEPARLAAHALLLDVAAAGKRLVAVGMRGHILWSDDGGQTWTQSESVPVRALLTGVCFFDGEHGIAVGHDEVILVTRDAGSTWQRSRYAPEAQRPLLDVWCGPGGRSLAVGAYGAFFLSEDGGATWQEAAFEPVAREDDSQEEAFDDLGGGYHLNALVPASPERLYIAAEGGHLYRSDDAGQTWIELPSPYEGSFFGLLPLSTDAVLAFGLRGRLFASNDGGMSWRRIETDTQAMLTDAVRLQDGRVVIVGLAGTVLIGNVDADHYELRQQDDRKGLAAVVAVEPETLVVAGEAGVRRIHLGRQAGARP